MTTANSAREDGLSMLANEKKERAPIMLSYGREWRLEATIGQSRVTINLLAPWLPSRVSFSSHSLPNQTHCVKQTQSANRKLAYLLSISDLNSANQRGRQQQSTGATVSSRADTRHPTDFLVQHLPRTLLADLRIITFQFTVDAVDQ